MPLNLNNFGKGCVPQPKDMRDYRLELIAGNFVPLTEFSVRDKISRIKSQNGSSSCVGQSFAYYVEILNKIETGQNVEMSARDIYSKIFQPGGGAYLRDACKILAKEGINEEKDIISYENGNPPSEAFVRQKQALNGEKEFNSLVYSAKAYFSWNSYDWEMYKKAIRIGNGCVIGSWGNNPSWQGAMLEVPASKDVCNWAHATLCTGFVKINGKEYLEFVNSWGDDWGDKGFGYMPKEYVEKGLVFNTWTLTDRNNSDFGNIISTWFKLRAQAMNITQEATELLKKLKK